jgi:hypothetical protein
MRLRRLWAVAFTAAVIALPHAASADFVGPSSAPKSAVFDGNVTTTAAALIPVSASSGFAIRVWSIAMQNDDNGGAVTLTFGSENTAGTSCATGNTALTPGWRLGSLSAPVDQLAGGGQPLMVTTGEGRDLCITGNATRAVNVHVVYTEVDLDAATYDSSYPVDVTDTAFGVSGQPVDVTCSDGCSGGAGGGDVTLTAVEGDALAWFTEWREIVILAGGLGVFLLTGLVVRTFPRKRLPL